MLVDNITIHVKAGDGGNGSVHFRRNAQTAKGGPDGGNGGNGGNVSVQGIDDIMALSHFRFQKKLAAENGIKGAGQNLFGRNGKELIIHVPLGTLVTETANNRQFEVSDTTTKILVAKGGIGGRGNNEFKSATNQTPRFAEKGTQGEEKELQLELRLIADIGFIGLPNAGKSTLLSILTNAKPKIGDYPFTTLEPNIGMMHGVILADIPGLIEGASLGKGLGIAFLRHIEKTKLLVHCIDSTTSDVLQSYQIVREELAKYNSAILAKKEIIILTKSDLTDEKKLAEQKKKLQKENKDIFVVSAINDDQVATLSQKLLHFVHENK